MTRATIKELSSAWTQTISHSERELWLTSARAAYGAKAGPFKALQHFRTSLFLPMLIKKLFIPEVIICTLPEQHPDTIIKSTFLRVNHFKAFGDTGMMVRITNNTRRPILVLFNVSFPYSPNRFAFDHNILWDASKQTAMYIPIGETDISHIVMPLLEIAGSKLFFKAMVVTGSTVTVQPHHRLPDLFYTQIIQAGG